MNGKSTKVHVVAHCVGGLSIHMALMGGHISATQIASLSCTNSSMFFKLTPSSTFKMWLPLIPVSSFLPLILFVHITKGYKHTSFSVSVDSPLLFLIYTDSNYGNYPFTPLKFIYIYIYSYFGHQCFRCYILVFIVLVELHFYPKLDAL